MENTLHSTASSAQSALQNAQGAASTLKLVLVWLAVGIPMLWGMMKALEDVPALTSLFR
jgi:hypothetical protein